MSPFHCHSRRGSEIGNNGRKFIPEAINIKTKYYSCHQGDHDHCFFIMNHNINCVSRPISKGKMVVVVVVVVTDFNVKYRNGRC